MMQMRRGEMEPVLILGVGSCEMEFGRFGWGADTVLTTIRMSMQTAFTEEDGGKVQE